MKKLSALLFNQGGRCFYCDEILDIHDASIDHVIPQSKGGSDDMDNLVVCCKYANRAFGDCSPKQKITVAKNLCTAKLGCQKIFLKETTLQSEKQHGELQEVTTEYPTRSQNSQSILIESNQTGPSSQCVQNTSIVDRKNNQIHPTTYSLSKAYQFLYQAIDALEKQGAEVVSCRLKQEIRKLEPSFKESDYGFNQFNKFLLQAKKDKVIALENYKKTHHYLVKKV